MRMLKEKTAAMAIDYQKKLLPAINNTDKIVKNSAMALEGLRVLDVPVVFTEQNPIGLGGTYEAFSDLMQGCRVFAKNTFSAYETPEIKECIDGLGVESIILMGTETHICVLQTAIDLISAGYNVYIAADCVGSRTEANREYGLMRAQNEGAFITSCEAMLFELLRAYGTDEFKSILKIIK